MFYKIAVAVLYPIFKILFGMKIIGREKIPTGAAVVCVNHTSMADAIFVALAFGVNEKFAFMAKKELFDNPFLRVLLNALGAFPVDRGAADLSTIRKSISALKDGKKLLIFPEGRRIKGGNEDKEEVKSGIAMISLRASAPMLPVYLSARKRLFGKTLIIVGDPIIPEKKEGTNSENYHRISTEVFETIIKLGESAE